MLSLTVSEIIHAAEGVLILGDPSSLVGAGSDTGKLADEPRWPPHGISIDTRTLQKGDVYFAVRGDRYDGHRFVNEAIRKGASVCVISQMPPTLNINLSSVLGVIKVKDTRKALADISKYYRKKYGKNVFMVSVSGSCGKTTVKEMVVHILKGFAPTIYSPGNHNNDVGCPVSLMAISPAFRYGVFELGVSAKGEVGRLADMVAPSLALITNINLEHTATFGSIKDIAEGESEVLSYLPENGIAVLPYEDDFFQFLKSKVPKNCRTVTYGFSEEADVCVTKISVWPGPTGFKIIHKDAGGKVLHNFDCSLPVMGKFNVLNACAAAAVSLALDVPPDVIRDGLKKFSLPAMRFNVKQLESGAILVDDSYNANPGSMRVSLESFVECFPDKKRCLVLGDMLELGEISRKEHYALGEFVAKLPVSKVLLFGPQSHFVAEGARDSLQDEKTFTHCADKDSLLKEVQSVISAGTAVIFKASRGMRLDEVIEKLA